VTPAPFELPLRPSDATQLAHLIFDQAERRRLTDEVRNRLAARAAVLHLESITPWLGSLVRDPVHPSTYYVAVDAAGGAPLLLHLATAAAPTSSIFGAAVLIGRMRGAASEVVINAVPFGPGDQENLEKFAAKLDTAFLPRPQGTRAVVAIAPRHPARDLPQAFDAYRTILKRSGRNLAHLLATPAGPSPREVYLAGLWSAIRAGWREGYSLGVRIAAEEAILPAAACSTFVVDAPDREAVAQLYEFIRRVKSARPFGRSFDLQIPADLASTLEWLKGRSIPCQVEGSRLLGTVLDADQIAELGGTMSGTVT
jgi:hypothetical protein